MTRIRVMSKDLVIAESWQDKNGEAVPLGDETYYRVEYTYDKMGNINREKYNRVEYEKFYDTDGFAIMLPDGAVSYRYEYNDAGEVIKKTKYDYGDHEVE